MDLFELIPARVHESEPQEGIRILRLIALKELRGTPDFVHPENTTLCLCQLLCASKPPFRLFHLHIAIHLAVTSHHPLHSLKLLSQLGLPSGVSPQLL